MIDANRIISITYIGRKEVYDFTVQHYHNYIAAGLVHHNTESVGGYELTLHLTGQYPAWWEGRRFSKPIRAWAAGDTGKSTRDILQEKLLGPVGNFGTGLIPADCLLKTSPKSGVPDAIEIVRVRHASGGESVLVLKSFDQKRQAFQGTEQDVILLDEECDLDIYVECLLRTMPTGEFAGGALLLTFTPLKGLTPIILHLREARTFEIGVSWDDVPHLSAEAKADILQGAPPHTHKARSQGVPLLGQGAIFAEIAEESILVKPFALPPHYRQIGAMDFGFGHPFAAIKLAIDADSDTIYLTNEYACKSGSAPIHASALRAWGDWLPWAWPHDGLQHDKGSGEQLAKQYRDEKLTLLHEYAQYPETNDQNERQMSRVSVEAGVFEMQTRMLTGRWKVFETCTGWLEEFRNYHRDEHGKIVKQLDDRISASRCGMMMRRYAITKPAPIRGITMTGWRG